MVARLGMVYVAFQGVIAGRREAGIRREIVVCVVPVNEQFRRARA